MRRKAAALVALAVLAAGALSTVPAVAHSSLIGSTPEDGAVLSEAPDEVVLEFDSDVQPDFSQVAVLDADDNHYEDGDPEPEGATVTQPVTDMPAGDYRITYRVGSADGHPVDGVVSFTVETPDDDAAADQPETGDKTTDEPATEKTGPAASDGGSGDDGSAAEQDNTASAADDAVADGTEDDDGTPTQSVVVAVAAVVVVGIAGMLLVRRRPDADDDSPSAGS